jgi:hypothetical protein
MATVLGGTLYVGMYVDTNSTGLSTQLDYVSTFPPTPPHMPPPTTVEHLGLSGKKGIQKFLLILRS